MLLSCLRDLMFGETEAGGGKNGEMEKNVGAPNGPAPENRYGRTGGEGGAKMGFSFTRGRQAETHTVLS